MLKLRYFYVSICVSILLAFLAFFMFFVVFLCFFVNILSTLIFEILFKKNTVYLHLQR